MKTFAGVFGVAGAFGAVVAVAYWFFSGGEAAGTALLAVMTVALLVPLCYAILAERNAALSGDDPCAPPGTQETVGIVTTNTPYPVILALAALGFLAGILWAPLLAALSLAAMLLAFWRLGAESART